jgi:hypothetical protein
MEEIADWGLRIADYKSTFFNPQSEIRNPKFFTLAG